MPSASHAMTPTDSDCDESTPYHAPVSAFSPWTSPAQSQSQSQRLRSSQVPDSQSTVASSDAMDMDMPDWYHLSQGGSQGEHALTSVTPVHQMHPPRGSYTHGYSDGVMRTRRPPSPVSEGEPSPRPGSGGDMMAMAMDTPSKRGHVRSRYSVKSWGDDAEHLRLGMHGGGASGASGDTGDAAAAAAAAAAGQVDGETEEHTKKSFSMGYRNDCERCLRREKGHFSHFS